MMAPSLGQVVPRHLMARTTHPRLRHAQRARHLSHPSSLLLQAISLRHQALLPVKCMFMGATQAIHLLRLAGRTAALSPTRCRFVVLCDSFLVVQFTSSASHACVAIYGGQCSVPGRCPRSSGASCPRPGGGAAGFLSTAVLWMSLIAMATLWCCQGRLAFRRRRSVLQVFLCTLSSSCKRSKSMAGSSPDRVSAPGGPGMGSSAKDARWKEK